MSKYQGYPYVTKIVNDVPTIDSATASQWAHLPRKPIQPPLPRPAGSGAGSSRDNVSSPSESRPPTAQKKPDDDENPVVYIDLPSPGESDICTSIQTPSIEPEYVQNTFLYDPFDNKRIDVTKREEAASSSSNSASNDRTSPTAGPPRQPTQASSSSRPYDAQPSGSRPTPPRSLPGFMEKESLIYGGHGANEFPLSPIPISDFPEPPPAYTEVAKPPSTTPQSPTPAPNHQEPKLSFLVKNQYIHQRYCTTTQTIGSS
ncbi:unnamed protein product [Arctia plantaginis]|uniref:Uncharacterized protein n=1 Tax=Arctia plantaginis TaxID=874455 RepID=A0A8S0ZZS1_ARCPL|nr:unnamed protein product [Arctia plantaginis]